MSFCILGGDKNAAIPFAATSVTDPSVFWPIGFFPVEENGTTRCPIVEVDGDVEMATAQSGPRGQAPGERAGCKRAGVLQVGRELFPERGEGCWEAWEVSCGVRKEAHIGAAALGFGLLGRAQQGAGARGCRGRVSLCWNPNRAVSPLSRARFRAQTRRGEAHTGAYWRSHASTCAFAREPPAGLTSLKVGPAFMRIMVFSFKTCDCCACVAGAYCCPWRAPPRAHGAGAAECRP